MASANDGIGEYVRQVRESTQRYARDLLSENEKLLNLATAVHAEKVNLEDQLDLLRDQLARHRAIERSLMEQLSDMDQTRRELSARYLDVEQSNSNLANLYVASYHIHGSLDREQVIGSIHEVLINVVGSEQFAIFTRSPWAPTASFVVTSSMGLGKEACDRLLTDEGRIGDALGGGIAYVRLSEDEVSSAPGEPRLTACIPLMVGDSVYGAIAIFQLLAHKTALEPVDRELFDLLATHGASALYCTELHARMRAQEVRR
jgi:hypothetical protein